MLPRLDNGYTPSTIVLDAPLEIDQGPGIGVWRPENYEGKFYGPSTLRFGIEHSRNVMTVRLAQDIGMPLIADYAKRFGVYDDLPPYLSFSFGCRRDDLAAHGDGLWNVRQRRQAHQANARSTASRIATGIRSTSTTSASASAATSRSGKINPSPLWSTGGEQVLDPMTAYQITSMMEGVVQRGTATVVREVGQPVAGKTGTTNDEKDAWFIGFTPDIVVGVYMGYDKPRHIGRGATGGHLAAPIVKDFMKVALADKPAVPFRVPPGIKLIRVDVKTGARAGPGTERAVLEAFKPGTAPPSDGYSVVGSGDGRDAERPWGVGVTPDADRAVRSGTGGLY